MTREQKNLLQTIEFDVDNDFVRVSKLKDTKAVVKRFNKDKAFKQQLVQDIAGIIETAVREAAATPFFKTMVFNGPATVAVDYYDCGTIYCVPLVVMDIDVCSGNYWGTYGGIPETDIKIANSTTFYYSIAYRFDINSETNEIEFSRM